MTAKQSTPAIWERLEFTALLSSLADEERRVLAENGHWMVSKHN